MCGVFKQYRLDPVIRLFRSDVPDVGKAAALPVTVVTDPRVPTERLESPVGGLPPNEGEARDADGGNILRYILFLVAVSCHLGGLLLVRFAPANDRQYCRYLS